MAKMFNTTVSGIGPYCVEFDDGEIIHTRSEFRQRLIAAACNVAEPWPDAYKEMRRAILGMKLLIDALDKDGEFVTSLRPLSQKAVGFLDRVADKIQEG